MNDAVESRSFSHVRLPSVDKRVMRMGIAGNYGLETADIFHAAENGANLWLWTLRFRKVTPALRSFVARDPDKHVVAMLDVAYTSGMVRRRVERGLRRTGLERFDYYLLSWLGKGSSFNKGVQEELLELKEEGKVGAVGTSIHDRRRAGRLAEDSILDAFMIRYNAKHPGAEQDIFPHLSERDPTVIAYTATSWRQLITPMKGIQMPPWPGEPTAGAEHPPLTANQCYRFCLSSPHVHAVLTGPKNRAQLDANLTALDQGPLSPDEDAWIREYGRKVKARKRVPYL